VEDFEEFSAFWTETHDFNLIFIVEYGLLVYEGGCEVFIKSVITSTVVN
jgi:hypothetical protein